MDEQKAVYGIIGNPVEHSLSPLMHNTAFHALNVDADYKLFPLQEDELSGFFKDLREKSSPIFGLNVTVPYKEKVISHLDSLSPFAQRAMAVNTIIINKNRDLIGYNTDAPGFMAHLTELGFDACDKRIAILGAGGTTRAILTALCIIPERPTEIKLYNRTPGRAKRLIEDIGSRIDLSIAEPVDSVDDLNIEEADLLINATSVGLKWNDPMLIEERLLHKNMLVYDLIYNPNETALLKLAKKNGAKVANGLGMLYYQGVLSLQHWANLELDEKIKKKMRESIEKGVKG